MPNLLFRPFALVSLILLLASSAEGQIVEVPEGWGASRLPQTPERQAAFMLKLSGAQASFSENPAPPPASASTIVAVQTPDAATPEITALAAGLENDPMRIFNWVRRNIRYVPYAGCVKGAMLTLLERSGNDFDQCALLAALLRCGGVNVRYNLGVFFFSDATAANYWQTFEQNVTNNSIFSELGLPIDTNQGNRFIPRVYIVATLPNGEVKMDPSFRTYQSRNAMTLAQLTASCGISRTGLLTQAGGSNRPPPEEHVLWQYRQLNSVSLASYLNTGVNALISDLSVNNPNEYGDFLFAGYDQISGDITTWGQACTHLPDPGLYYPWLNDSENLPSDGCAQLDLELYSKPLDVSIPDRVPYKTLTLALPSLQGRRLDLRFESSAAVLTLDGEEIEREILPAGAGNYFGVKPRVRHQFTGWQQGMSGPTIYLRGGTYALAYACQASSHWVEHRRKKLASYHALPTSDPTREHKLKAESLFITGLNWMHQTEMATTNSTPMHGGRWIYQHRFGRVADEYAVQGGYFVDIPLQQRHSASHTTAWTPAVQKTSFLATTFMQSALEHGVVEQVLDPDSAAASIAGGAGVSTIKACVSAKTKSDAGYDYLYSLNPTLWGYISDVYDPTKSPPQYPASVLYSLADYNLIKQAMDEDVASKAATNIPDVNTTVFMPMDGRLGMQDWEGSGYMVLRETPSTEGLNVVMGISGALHGGFTTVKMPVPTQAIRIQTSTGTIVIQPPTLPWTLSFDPIDLATGFYYLSATDIVLGDGKLPRGATFTRSYHGSKVSEDMAGLGYGWNHSLNIQVLLRSEAALAMGEGTAEEAAGFAVAMLALYQLLDGTTATVAKDWAVAAEVANWGANQFTHNAAAVMLGDRTLQFHKLPDGTYLPARGSSVALTREGGDQHFVLRERHGNTYVFDAARKLSTVTDPWGKQAVFSWSGNRLSTVTDAFNRVVKFSNNGDQVQTVEAGSAGNTFTNQLVQFTIVNKELRDVSHWLLNPSRWGELSYYEYDSGGQHRITYLRDNENRVIARNIYDVDGRVSQQMSMGDTARTWDYKYAYGETVELKPAKEAGAPRDRSFYRFDSRNRQVLHIDGLGKSWTKSYDGQDHVVQELTPLTAGSITAGRTIYDANHNVTQRTDRYSRSEYWEYSQDGQFHLLKHTDRRGKETLFRDFNAEHQPQTLTDAEGRVTTLTYAPASSPGAGKVATVAKADQLKVTYSYADNSYGPGYGNATSITYPRTGAETADPVEQRGYSIHGDLTSLQTPRAAELGIEIVTTYDERRRKRTVTLPGSQAGDPNVVAETVYDSNGHVWKTIAPKGALTVAVDDFTTVNTYLASSKIDTTTTPDGIIRHLYDFQDNEVKVTDPLNLSVTMGYDAAGRKKTVSNPLDETVTSYFDDDGRGTRVADPLDHGDTLSYAEHAEGELQSSLNSLSHTSSRRLDKNGNWTHYTNARSKTWAMSYDDTGMMEELITPENRSHHSYHDNQGRKWKTVEPSLQEVELQFDARDRVETRTVKRADGSVESSASFTYDKNGNVLTVVEGRQTITRTYDRQDRVLSYTLAVAPLMNADVEVESGWGYTLGYRYDANGNLKELIYPDGRSVRYTYDEMDRMKTVTDWADRVTTYTWDAGGRLRRVDRPNKTARLLSYDDAGRLTRADEILPGETKGGVFPTAQYTFVLPTGAPSGALGWWKPNLGVYSISPSGWYSIFPQHLVPQHLANRPVFRRYGSYWPGINDLIPSPANGWVFFGAQVPASGLNAGEGAWIETRLPNVTPFFNGTTWQMGQWLSETSRWEYWIAGYATQPPTPSPTQPGRLISSQVFAYDAAGRVEKSFRLPQPHPLPSRPMTGATYDGDNRFLGCTEHPASFWVHDPDGNLTQGLLPAAGAAAPAAADFTWDVRNRLTSLVNTATAEQHHYRYDPEGNRVETRQPYSYYGYLPSNDPPIFNNPPVPPVLISGVNTSRRAISPHGPGGLSRVLVSWNNYGSGDRYYIHGLGLLYDTNGMTGAQEDLNYYHYDHQGNTTAITSAPPYSGPTNGLVLPHSMLTDTVRIKARWEYDPYGAVTHHESAGYQVSTPYLYGGEHGVMTDAATGLLHMRARYYHPYLKRFLSEDPIGFEGGMNWFAYANGDPLMKIDPSGNVVETVWDVANIGMGVYSAQDNWRQGNWGWFALDAVGLVYDGVATAVPFLPAGASAAFKASRAGNSLVHSVNAGMDVANVSNHVHDAARAIDTTASNVPWQAALDGSKLHRQVASQTSDSMRYFDSTYMAGASRSSGIQPDMRGAGIWADITTPGQWQKHVNHYTPGFGEGIPIMYQRGVGVVGTTRLLPGAGLGLSVLQGASGSGGAFSGLGGWTNRK